MTGTFGTIGIGGGAYHSYTPDSTIVPLSKNHTYGDIIDIVKMRCGIETDFRFPVSMLLKMVNMAIGNFSGDDSYRMKKHLYIFGTQNPYTVNLSDLNPFPAKIVNVVYLEDSRVPVEQVDALEIERRAKLTDSFQNTICYSHDGDSLSLLFGSAFNVWQYDEVLVEYNRQADTQSVTEANYATQKVDVLDSNIPLLIEIICQGIKN